MPQALTYQLSQCCSPESGDEIIGYFKMDGTISVHRSACPSVQGLLQDRLIQVTWEEIEAAQAEDEPEPIDPAFYDLEDDDYLILKHHQEYGVDYSIMVADRLGLPMEEVFERHRRLRELGALKRVEQLIIQYRKNIVKGKWIKHRNHTYYELTPKGERWVDLFEGGGDGES